MAGTRKIAAILVADVVGYSRLAGADEDRTLSRLRGLRSDLIDPAIAAHHGRIVKRTSDGNLIEFRSVVDAVRCANEMQNGMVERNAGVASQKRIEFRIGVHLGDVVEEADGDLMGYGRQHRCAAGGHRSAGRGVFVGAGPSSGTSKSRSALIRSRLAETPNVVFFLRPAFRFEKWHARFVRGRQVCKQQSQTEFTLV
jgi:hypothetical protein